MLVQTHFPHRLSAKRYDQYLASGWFRGSVMLYKMDVLCMENDLYSVLNIRLDLEKNELSRSLRKIQNRGNNRFKVSIGNVKITEEAEALYRDHKRRFKGFVHNTLREYLYSSMPTTVFNTKEVRVYDGEKLIACSYFDLGENSVASLLGVYDESYKNVSLGIFTMLAEMNFAKDSGFKWYYPGYILNESGQFDYKLRIGKFQFYNHNKRWVPFNGRPKEKSSALKMLDSLGVAKKHLDHLGLDYTLKFYPYFGIGYLDMWDESFLKSPAVLQLESKSKTQLLLLSYDLTHEIYSLDLCVNASGYEHLIQKDNMPASDKSINKLLRIKIPLAQSYNALQIANTTFNIITNGEL